MKTLIFSISCLLFSINLLAQTIIKVSQVPGEGDYSDLQAAIEGATAGSTLMIYPGTYPAITLNKSLNLIGTGYELATNYPEVKTFPVLADISSLTCNSLSSGSTITSFNISSLSIIGSSNMVISKLNLGTAVIENAHSVIIEKSVISGLQYYAYQGGFRWGSVILKGDCVLILNSVLFTLQYYQFCGGSCTYFDAAIASQANALSIEIDNCIFFVNLDLSSTSGVKLVKNSIGVGAHGTVSSAGSVNNFLQIDPNLYFVGYPTQGSYTFDSKFQLKPTAPAKNAATHGGDCGIFGGPDPYKLGGLPSIPLIYEFNAPGSAPTGGNVQIQIKARSEN